MKKTCGLIVIIGILLIIQSVNAQTWLGTKRLSWTTGWSYNPRIAKDSSDYLHVVWSDYTPGPDEIYYKKSIDGGATWKTKRITWTPGYSYSPDIAIDTSDHIHVVWYDNTNWNPGKYEIYYKKSTDGGATWSPTKRLSWNSGESKRPVIATDSSGQVHVVWSDDSFGPYELYHKKSTDGGITWSGASRLTWLSGSSIYPAVCTDLSNNVHVAWHDDTSGNWEIYYKRSTDGGTTWTTRRLTWDTSSSMRAAIASDSNGFVHVVWKGLYYKRSTDGGKTWGSNKQISDGGSAGIAISSLDNIYIARYNNNEIYFLKSMNSGLDWTVAKRITWNSGESLYPKLTADSGENIHIVWQDDTPGNFEIYYKKGIQ
jgi:hypothetical protein